MLVAGAQPTEHLADHTTAPADAQVFAIVQKYRQPPAAQALPQMAGLDGLARDGAPPPVRRHPAAAGPDAGGGVQPADPFQHEGHELRGVAAPVQQLPGALAQPALDVLVEPRNLPGKRLQPRAVQQQAPVAQVSPAVGQVGVHGSSVSLRPSTGFGPFRVVIRVGMKAPCRVDIEVVSFRT